jgi:putative RNA 2'-phosphotransferase
MIHQHHSQTQGRMHTTDPKLLRRRSTKVSWLLRHGANERGLAMGDDGFAAIVDVLQQLRMSRLELDEVVAENNKARFEVRGGQIRAVQGHSLEGTPVTLEGLERSWALVVDDDRLFHGTSVAAAFAILGSEGVHAAARTHVHLAGATDAVVGKRHQVDVLLVVDPHRLRTAGERIFRAPNGVLLTRAVPRAAVVDVVSQSRRGAEARGELLAALNGSDTPRPTT